MAALDGVVMRDINYILVDVDNEICKATAQHGPMLSSHEAYGVILEEVDEFWDEVKMNPAKMDDEGRTKLMVRMRKELIKVAAMAIRAIKDLGLTDAK